MGIFWKYYFGTAALGAWIAGYENSQLRNKKYDELRFLKYTIGGPITVPLYLIKHGNAIIRKRSLRHYD